MYYEIYVDSLFLINFVMNMFLLCLVNGSLNCAATRLRILLGAGVGAMAYFLPFLWNGPGMLKLVAGAVLGSVGMILIAFPIQRLKAFWIVLYRLLLFSFLMGGLMLFLMRRIPIVREYMMGIMGLLGIGNVMYLGIVYPNRIKRRKKNICWVTLVGKEGSMKVAALIDSGNSLMEPISGKPVSIIDAGVWKGFGREESCLYRAIPYTSIGKKRGILKGYLLREIQIEVNGIVKSCKDVYVAVSEDKVWEDDSERAVKMILNPTLLDM